MQMSTAVDADNRDVVNALMFETQDCSMPSLSEYIV